MTNELTREHKLDCDINSNNGIPKAQKDKSYCTCVYSLARGLDDRAVKKLQDELTKAKAEGAREEREWIRKVIDSHTYSDGEIDMYADELIDEIEKLTKKD